MATIGEFIDHRWHDARLELQKLIDPPIWEQLEREFRLEKVRLITPTQRLASFSWPKLAGGWHGLLEACLELVQTRGCMLAAVTLLEPARHDKSPPPQAGREVVHHFRSWFAFALATAERTQAVINKTVDLHAPRSEATGVKKKYEKQVYEGVTKHVERQRHDYLHGFRRSWASGISEDGLWEAEVFLGMLPERVLTDFFYPGQRATMRRDYQRLKTATERFDAVLGAILADLEFRLGIA